MAQLADEAMIAQALVRAKSPSGSESPAAAVLLNAFERLGFDEAYNDEAGNAIGIIRRDEGPTVMFNGHVDTVPAGDPKEWPHPPYSGEIVDGMLWGRGSCDMKGPLASMTAAAADAARSGFAGTIIVSGVVQEEVGGLGARYLSRRMAADAIVLGEPSDLKLMLGHRGRVEALVTLPGKIAHAAKASLGENALYRAARYLRDLENLSLPEDTRLGRSTATPTGIELFPGGANVVPGSARLTIDYRNVVGDEPDEVIERLSRLDPEAVVTVGEENAVSENGALNETFPRINPAYLTPDEAPQVSTARRAVQEALASCEREFSEDVWWFATDAPYLSAIGAPIIGFGPGDPELAHTSNEAIPLEQLAIARSVYARLALALLEPA